MGNRNADDRVSQEPAWLTSLLEELAARERFPETPALSERVLSLLTVRRPGWRSRRTAAVAGAATLSVGAVVIMVVGLLRGRLAHGHA